MKIILVNDLHFGYKNDSGIFLEYQSLFFERVFFPYIDKHNINTIIDLGDTFDRRKYINFEVLQKSKLMYFNEIQKRKINYHVLLGNHTTYYKNTSNVNSPQLLFDGMDNFFVYSDPVDITIDNTSIAMVPWINDENNEKFLQFIKTTPSVVSMGHYELKGFEVHRGIPSEEGMDKSLLNGFKKVYSGHFHQKSDNGHVYYLGTQYDMSFADIEEVKGFHVFDTNTLEVEFIQNPYKLFYKVIYKDEDAIPDFTQYKNKFVKLVIKSRKNSKQLEKYLSSLYDANPAEVNIIDEVDILSAESDEDIDVTQDTLHIIYKSIDDDKTLGVNKNKLKNVLSELYVESNNII